MEELALTLLYAPSVEDARFVEEAAVPAPAPLKFINTSTGARVGQLLCARDSAGRRRITAGKSRNEISRFIADILPRSLIDVYCPGGQYSNILRYRFGPVLKKKDFVESGA